MAPSTLALPDAWLWALVQRVCRTSRASLRLTCRQLCDAVDATATSFSLTGLESMLLFNWEHMAPTEVQQRLMGAAAARPNITTCCMARRPPQVAPCVTAVLSRWARLTTLALPMSDAQAIEQLPRSCPQLLELRLCARRSDSGEDVAATPVQLERLAHSLAALTGLAQLRRLSICQPGGDLPPPIWGAITALGQLTALHTLDARPLRHQQQPSGPAAPAVQHTLLTGLSGLRSLSLCAPEQLELGALAHLEELQLCLAGEQLPASISSLHQLTSLRLSRCDGGGGGGREPGRPPLRLPAAGALLRQLRCLDVVGWTIDDVAAAALAAATALTALRAEQLQVGGSSCDAQWPALRRLTLSSGAGCKRPLALLAPQLHELELSAQWAGMEGCAPDGSADALCALQGHSQLSRLRASTAHLGCPAAAAAAAEVLQGLAGLRQVAVCVEEGVAQHARSDAYLSLVLKQLTQVTSLVLEGISSIERLSLTTNQLPRLQRVELRRCGGAGVSGGSGVALQRVAAQLAVLPGLKQAVLDDARALITPAALAALGRSSSLQQLQLVRARPWPGRIASEARYVAGLVQHAQVLGRCSTGLRVEVVEGGGGDGAADARQPVLV